MKEAFMNAFPRLAKSLGASQVDALLRVTRLVDLPAERILFRDRMPVESIFMVLSGRLAVTVGEGERSVALGEVGAGEWLGEVSVLSGSMTAAATVRTLSPCRALKLHYQDFDRLIRDNDQLASTLLADLIELLAARLRVSAAATGQQWGA
ncbi:cyclic nucleotide-binding domain-containing protein [Chitinimonas sp.]|uniref:cyclic nucleotide-binding domain-containing protein n=1 Tax=Chitinimonas sp. TaxID=1934313 RepID=UPI0035B26CE5